MISINELWHSRDVQVWKDALARYWEFVKCANQERERELEQLDLATLERMNAQQWYYFLLDKYFPWKFTVKCLCTYATKHLQTYADEGRLDELHVIRHRLLRLHASDVRQGLLVARDIKGLGIPGASGLLALMYPQSFGTVDQFVVKALRGVRNLPEADKLQKMKEKELSIEDGVLLIGIMQRKAVENNCIFGTTDWTPRKIDKVLWTFGR